MCMSSMNYIQLIGTPDIKCLFQILMTVVEVTALLKIKMHFFYLQFILYEQHKCSMICTTLQIS